MTVHIIFETYQQTLFWIPIVLTFNGATLTNTRWCVEIHQDATNFKVISLLYDGTNVSFSSNS